MPSFTEYMDEKEGRQESSYSAENVEKVTMSHFREADE